MLVDLVLDQAVPHGIARLLERVRLGRAQAAVRQAMLDETALVAVALEGRAEADFPALELTRQLVGGEELEQVLGRLRAHRLAVVGWAAGGALFVEVQRIANDGLPARRQFAGNLGVDTLAHHLAGCGIKTIAGTHCLVLALGVVQRRGDVQGSAEQFALGAELVGFTLDRVQRMTALRLVRRLGLEDFGVAGVQRPLLCDVQHQGAKRGDFAAVAFLDPVVGVETRHHGAHVVAVIRIARAQGQVQRVGQLRLEGGVGAGFALVPVRVVVVNPGRWRFGHGTGVAGVDVERDVDRAGSGQVAVVGVTADDFGVVGTDQQFVVQTEGLEFTGDVGIEQVLLIAVATDEARENRAIGDIGCDRTLDLTDVLGGIEFALGVAGVDLPVVVEGVFDLAEVLGALVVVG
ncbi:hypothetical protein D3C77_227850 [compost metagenome]